VDTGSHGYADAGGSPVVKCGPSSSDTSSPITRSESFPMAGPLRYRVVAHGIASETGERTVLRRKSLAGDPAVSNLNTRLRIS
jgi:hypothetical protein